MTESPVTSEFMAGFLSDTESRWAESLLNPHIYGFQFQAGTKWNPGLSEAEIASYQALIGVDFPDDLVVFLRHANGTDTDTKNIYGSEGARPAHGTGVYSYPRDWEIIEDRIARLKEDWSEMLDELRASGVDLGISPKFIPFYSHRYVLSNGDPTSSIVCSIVGSDAIVYGWNLKEYLEKEFLD